MKIGGPWQTLYHIRTKSKRQRNWKWWGEVFTLEGALVRIGEDALESGEVTYEEFNRGRLDLCFKKKNGMRGWLQPVIPIDTERGKPSSGALSKFHDSVAEMLRSYKEYYTEEE